MKTKSNSAPVAPYDAEINGAEVTLRFYDNVTEETTEETAGYEYDEYVMTVPNRDNLLECIDNNIDAWVAAAKAAEYEQLAGKVREKRDKLLEETDKEMALDRMGLEIPTGTTITSWLNFLKALGDHITGPWAGYRQELRDIPSQPGFPYDVEFPEKPEGSD